MENPIKMDDLGIPLFSETSILPLVSDPNPKMIDQSWDPPQFPDIRPFMF